MRSKVRLSFGAGTIVDAVRTITQVGTGDESVPLPILCVLFREGVLRIGAQTGFLGTGACF